MFNKMDISQLSNKKSFDRGLTMARCAENIISRKVSRLEDASEISGKVRSASGLKEYFDSVIVVDRDMDRVIDYECNCPASVRFNTMCKHCVALGLTFLAEPKTFNGFQADTSPKTSRSLAGFMQIETASNGMISQGGKVHIDVELIHDFGNWSARFDIGDSQAGYVMPSPKAFAHAMKLGTFVSYGKKLAFTHTLDAFDESSAQIANIITHAVELRSDIATGPKSSSARTSSVSNTREIELNEFEVADILDALGSATFKFTDTARSAKVFNMHTLEEDPDIPLRIIENEGEGFKIMRDHDFAIASSGRSTYLFMDDVAYRCSKKFSKATRFLESVYLSNDDELILSYKDAPLFCAATLPDLCSALEVKAPAKLQKLMRIDGKIAYFFDLIRVNKKEIITVEVHVAYGDYEFMLADGNNDDIDMISYRVNRASALTGNDEDARNPEDQGFADAHIGEWKTLGQAEEDELMPVRNERLERYALDALSPIFDHTLRLEISEEQHVGALLFGGLEALREIGEVFTTSNFDKLLNAPSPKVSLGLSIDGNLLNMDVSPSDIDRDELVAVLKSYRRKKRFHRLRSGAYLSLADMELAHFSRLAEDLSLTDDEILNNTINLPAYRAFLLDREYTDIVRDDTFEQYISSFDQVDQSAFKAPDSLAKLMRPYQLEGFKWLSALSELGFGGILADEMGLGKTLQIISLILSKFESGALDRPVLIVCPASLVYNWVEEFTRFAPAVTVAPVEGLKVERSQIRRKSDVNVFIASYDIARIDVDAFKKMAFSYIVLDEAQYIKNHATKTAKAVKSLVGDHRFALTGTPIENRLSEIWSIFDFLMPGFLGSYAYFMQRYEVGILGGDEVVADRLQSLVEPFVLRRLKDNVLTELPEKIESVIHVPLTGEQAKLYAASEQNLRETLNSQKRANASRIHRRGLDGSTGPNRTIEVLAELTRLRQIALDPSLVFEGYKAGAAKAPAIMELVEQAIDGGERCLVFSQFTSYLDILKRELARRDISFFEITGATAKRERLRLVNKFNNGDIPVFLVSLKAGGTGLNLTGASVVIHADPWWIAAAINQASDRAHRIGQQKTVNVYKIIAKDTIEERIELLQEKKTLLADSIIKQADAISLANLTKDELEYLLSD